MSESVKATFPFKVEYLLRGYEIHYRHRSSKIRKYGLPLVGLLYIYFAYRSFSLADSVYGIAFGIFFLICAYFFIHGVKSFGKWRIRKNHLKRPDRDASMTLGLDSEGVHVAVEGIGKGKHLWQSFTSAIFLSEGIMIYPNEQVFYFWPREAFSSEEDFSRAQALIENHVSTTRE